MEMGTLDLVSNRAAWLETYELYNEETGENFDVSDATEITLQLRNSAGALVLTARLTEGDITVPDLGVIQWRITPERMAAIIPQTYECGLVITFPEEFSEPKVQLLIGRVPIVEGHAH